MAERLSGINGAKLLLIAGVVLIHCNLTEAPDFGRELPSVASVLIDYVSKWLCSVCVPLFFLLSGFLFFRPDDRLTAALYGSKLRSRARSLLVPYLLWNTLAGVLFMIKVSLPGFESYGVQDNPWLLFDGYWSLSGGYPFDFVLWFLRNLIVMCVLSPLAWLAGRNNYGMAALALFFLLTGHDLWGGLYFVCGVWLRVHPGAYAFLSRELPMAVAAPIWLGLGAVYTCCSDDMPLWLVNGLWPLFMMAAFRLALGGGRLFHGRADRLAQLVFFVYAWHGLYCSVVRAAMMHATGCGTVAATLLAYVLTFVVLMVSSVLVYMVARRLLPRLTSALTGGR